ncbi:GNAT family N-acetyltransferase [Legionella fallonii]|uniref:Putative acetyltransferase, GNAT family n=1 Tax=Legionella fallonii LLAP-10 TaxID=1212491 RepID=A0A098G8Y4_9GAMM|nr:N-acetyltransferase [Legionella fallonii]CEG58459.1 putative acetyltransferase, GNAT family [Legionella fallonii LLAP-10]
MEYRRPIGNDFEQMVRLQNKNLTSALGQSDRADGFLSAAFSAEQFQAMDADLGVMVCSDLQKVCGYICSSSIKYNEKIPIVSAMLKRFSELHYQGRALAEYYASIYGPACIDKAYRGQNILSHLFNHLLNSLRMEHKEMELLTAFIANDNERSINAHKKLNMDIAGEFEFDKTRFSILVYPMHS